jgi:hypothetical protein
MRNDVPSPTGQPIAMDDDVEPNREQTADEERLSRLPPEEHDEDRAIGGGMLDEGGTAVTRGTGTLGGEAQGRDIEADDENQARKDLDGETAFPTEPGGGTR